MMGKLLKDFRDLETRVLNELTDLVNSSKHKSKYTKGTVIKVDLNDKVEIVIINDRLTFIDNRGLYQSIFNESLEDLIMILEKNQNN